MTSRRIPCGGGASSPISYAAATASTARAADSSSRACTSASTWPAATVCPRFARHTTPTAWSIASSFVRRPPPSSSAAMPTAMRAHARHDPGTRRATSRTTAARGKRRRGRDRRPARGSSARIASRADPSVVACSARSPASSTSHAEIGEGEQPRARVEHELGEVRRALAAIVSTRLPHLERVADGRARAAGPCR